MRNIVSPLDGFASPFGRRGLSKYAIGNFDPALVADFDDEYYRANRQKTTFDGLLTHSRLSRATMVDSDGLIKWGPHNLLTYSEEFDNAAWGKLSAGSATPPVVTSNDATAPDGTVTADKVTFSRSGDLSGDVSELLSAAATVEAVNYTGGVWLKAATPSDVGKQLGIRHVAAAAYQVYTLTADWVKVSIVEIGAAGSRSLSLVTRGVITADRDVSAHIWGAHLYRSDLGGMVNNPDRGDSYVPTTSSARYLPRRGHHVWNGSAWVNEGLLIETEARTNLLHTTNALVTQTITVTAVPHTLHFTGTGTVTLSGASTDGPLVGTGTGEQNRVSLTFTPTAGLLMLIVTGTVADAQLEVGSTPSSYIPNLAASGTVNRTPDILTIPSANLPWPTPKVIGPELVTNGTFDTDTSGWAAVDAATSSSVGSQAEVVINSAPEGIFQNLTTVAGEVYMVSYTIGASTADAGVRVHDGSYAGSLVAATSFSGDARSGSFYFVAPSTLSTVYLRGTTNGTAYFDNISVREIDPLAVSIQMDGRVTGNTYTTTRWHLDANNYITQEINSSDFTFEQAASGTVDVVTGGSFTSGVNTPFNFASTHASTLVAAAVGGTALTDNTTPVALPNLSATDLNVGHAFMGTLKLMRVWSANITEAGREEAST